MLNLYIHKNWKEEWFQTTCEEGQTLKELIQRLQIPWEKVGLLIIDGHSADEKEVVRALYDDAHVEVFPTMNGV